MMPQSALILAAGFGERMRPLTLERPKPLLMLGKRTILDHALDRMREAAIPTIVVNTHYKGEMIHAHLAASPVIFSDEATVLETGGGIRQALPLLTDPFFTANADTVWRDGAVPAVERLAAGWDGASMATRLLLVPTPAGHPGDYFLAADGRLRYRGDEPAAPYLYAGLNIMQQKLVAAGPVGAFSQKRLWDAAEAAGRLYGLVHDGDWYHLGTPEELAAANAIFK